MIPPDPAVVGGNLDNRDSFLPQQVFFPLFGVRGHVHHHAKPQAAPDDAYAQPQVAGGAHGDGVAGEKLPEAPAVQHGVVVVFL